MKSEYNLKAKQIALSRDMDKILLMYKGWKKWWEVSSSDVFRWLLVCLKQPAILHIKITIKY